MFKRCSVCHKLTLTPGLWVDSLFGQPINPPTQYPPVVCGNCATWKHTHIRHVNGDPNSEVMVTCYDRGHYSPGYARNMDRKARGKAAY